MAQSSVLLPRVGAVGWRPLEEGADQALLPEIEGTVAARSLWSDAAATGISVGDGANMAAITIGASASDPSIQLGASGSTVTIPGNLTVNGATTTVSTTNLSVSDNLIYGNAGGLDPSFCGIAWDQGAALDVITIYNPTDNRVEIGRFNTIGGTTAPAAALATLEDLRISDLSLAGTGITADAALAVTATGADLDLAATGANNVVLRTNGADRWSVTSAGHLQAAGTLDIGEVTQAASPRTVYAATSVVVGTTVTVTSGAITGSTALALAATGANNLTLAARGTSYPLNLTGVALNTTASSLIEAINEANTAATTLQTLAVTLGEGNNSGAFDIEMASGQVVRGVDTTGGSVVVRGGTNTTGGGGGQATLASGSGNGSGGGGAVSASGGAGGATGAGGPVFVTGGTGGSTSGNGGQVSLVGGTATSGSAGNASLRGGGAPAGVSAGNSTVQAGGGSGAAGAAFLIGGSASGANNPGGRVEIRGGSTSDGNGGRVQITGAVGVGTNRSGGSLLFVAGTSTGTTAGPSAQVDAGNCSGSGPGGQLRLRGGSALGSGLGGPLDMLGGASTSGTGGAALLQGGFGSAASGSVAVHGSTVTLGTKAAGGVTTDRWLLSAAGHLQVVTGQTLDIGEATQAASPRTVYAATSVVVGTTVTVTSGAITGSAALGLDATTGTVSLGAATATALTIGRAGVTVSFPTGTVVTGLARIKNGTAITVSDTADSGERMVYDPTGGTFTLSAPLSPAIGDRWGVKNRSASVVAITVAGNGSDIEDPTSPFALTASFLLSGDGASADWEYDGTQWLSV